MKDKQSTNSSKLLSTRQVAKRLGMKNYSYIGALIKNGKFPNALKIGKEWRIPIRDVEFHELNMNKTTGCLNVKNTAKRLGYEKHKILSLLNKQNFQMHSNIYMNGGYQKKIFYQSKMKDYKL